eukprot:TRINITY_DN13753_c0_g1_i1.p1 TRINITY_DN13753_c0_g1~~TRINITY_DN13753_c0_g1_i1.p1  ORF type:complete len:148 (-),score=14.86 TRINITY_DN13753_c0_g1_i1:203-604(-)
MKAIIVLFAFLSVAFAANGMLKCYQGCGVVGEKIDGTTSKSTAFFPDVYCVRYDYECIGKGSCCPNTGNYTGRAYAVVDSSVQDPCSSYAAEGYKNVVCCKTDLCNAPPAPTPSSASFIQLPLIFCAIVLLIQ